MNNSVPDIYALNGTKQLPVKARDDTFLGIEQLSGTCMIA